MDLPGGHTVRSATPDDVAAVCALVIAVDVEEYGEPDYEEADVRDDWGRERFSLADDTWVVDAPDGSMAGYAAAWDKQPHALVVADAFCDPAGPDLYPWLVAAVSGRAQEHAQVSGETVTHVFSSEPNARRAAALRDAGYAICRVFRRMIIDLDVPPPAWRPKPGVAVRPVTPDDLRTCWELQRESFARHFDYVAESYESWHARLVDSATYRPRYWWIAEVDGAPAGVLIGQQHDEANGWVKTLGTLPPARGRGAGTALLLTAFEAFRRDGMTRAGLGVDSDNSTGAMELYERIGMRAEQRYDCYERVFTRT